MPQQSLACSPSLTRAHRYPQAVIGDSCGELVLQLDIMHTSAPHMHAACDLCLKSCSLSIPDRCLLSMQVVIDDSFGELVQQLGVGKIVGELELMQNMGGWGRC